MTLLASAEAFLACTWLGSYLFTQCVVSPALASWRRPVAERVRLRSLIGRRFGRLAAPFLLAWLLLLGARGVVEGVDAALSARLVLLVVLIVAAALHGLVLGRRLDALAEREAAGGGTEVVRAREAVQRRSARLTPVALIASLALAAWTALEAGAAG